MLNDRRESDLKVEKYVELYQEILKMVESKTDLENKERIIFVANEILQEVSKDIRTEENGVEKRKTKRRTEYKQAATKKQKNYLDNLYANYPGDITKEEASNLIQRELAKKRKIASFDSD